MDLDRQDDRSGDDNGSPACGRDSDSDCNGHEPMDCDQVSERSASPHSPCSSDVPGALSSGSRCFESSASSANNSDDCYSPRSPDRRSHQPRSPVDDMCRDVDDDDLPLLLPHTRQPAGHSPSLSNLDTAESGTDEAEGDDEGDAQPGSPGDGFYCICQQPADMVDDRFMICCDECSDWFHGDCVGITEKRSKSIEIFFCPPCRDANPSLGIVYRPSKKHDKRHEPQTRKRSSRMCGECEACVRPDCGTCRFCEDMRKFGGPNKLRQKCMYRRCLNLSKPVSDTQMALDAAWTKRHPDDDLDVSPKPRKSRAEREAQKAAKEAERARKKAERAEKKAAGKDKATEKRPRGRPSLKTKHRPSSSGSSKSHADRADHYRDIQQCWGPQCTKPSRSSSKYCSDECGQALAMKRLKRFLPDRFELWGKIQSKSHVVLRENINELKVEESEILEKLGKLKEKSQRLESIFEYTRTLQADLEEEVPEAEQDVEVDLQIDCVCCGHPTNARRALQHMERCYSRIEGVMTFSSSFKTKQDGVNIFCDFFSQEQYCKRLRVLCPDHYKGPKVGQDDVCGCPLTPDVFSRAQNYCRQPKRDCQSHVGWERLRQATLDMERLNWLLKLEEVQDHIHILQEQCRANGHVLGVLLHATIPHGDDDDQTQSFSMLHGFGRAASQAEEPTAVKVVDDADAHAAQSLEESVNSQSGQGGDGCHDQDSVYPAHSSSGGGGGAQASSQTDRPCGGSDVPIEPSQANPLPDRGDREEEEDAMDTLPAITANLAVCHAKVPTPAAHEPSAGAALELSGEVGNDGGGDRAHSTMSQPIDVV